ncbi:inovirus Gp2 family protein [Citrobacter sp. Awk 4]|uniref:inovirus Gp2 family protein n=1 Tax=Citrobacter sp. Awk 4 TaxID=2963955 RepID=UPI002302DE07|nr:inovirus Gp2 family protein [Citrobacter sp. Awk 4]MDA8479326.1 inovirus Gp2 family protein [Citrobacter sp. Awk 4]
MKTYLGTHGLHNEENLDTMQEVIDYATDDYTSITVVRVDTHYPPILEDTVCCFPNLEPGAISRFINSLKEILKNSERRRRRNGTRVHPNTLRSLWAKEYSQSGKCHFHVCLIFNEQAYKHLGDDKVDTSLRMMITRAWYSALGMDMEDYHGLVHFPENCRYILDQNSPDYIYEYGMLFIRLDYLTKLESKNYEEGERNFGGSRK